MNLFIGYIKFIYSRYQLNHVLYYFVVVILYEKSLIDLWMQEKMEEDYGSSYAIIFYISMIRKNNKLFTLCS